MKPKTIRVWLGTINNMTTLPFVSIIIPCWNEEEYIEMCLDSIIFQDYPQDKIEILIIDGNSIDNTKKIINTYVKKYNNIKLYDNHKKITPIALNIGIHNAKGALISKTDAHSMYPKDYISKCVHYILKYNADCVGGFATATPKTNTIIAKTIAYVLSEPRIGGGLFRNSTLTVPLWTDTAFGCIYKKNVFKKIGLFNEALARSQDMEFNLRLKRAGGKILLAPDVHINYYPKNEWKDFFVHNIRDGIWVIYPLKFTFIPFKLRHYAPLLFISTLALLGGLILYARYFSIAFVLLIGAYLTYLMFLSHDIVRKEKNWYYFLSSFFISTIRLIGYGLGSFLGIFYLLLSLKRKRL